MKLSENITESEMLLLEALPGAATIVSEYGDVITSNKLWFDNSYATHWFAIPEHGGNYFEHCHRAVEQGNDFALKMVFGLRDILDGEKRAFELTIPIRENGKKHWFRVSIAPFGTAPVRALIVVEDISKNMQAVQALRDSEERYTHQFMYSVSGILLSSPEGEIYDANPAACKILGYSKEELKTGGRSLIVDENDPQHLKAHQIRSEKRVFEGEKTYIHKTGRKIPVEIASILYRTENGDLRTINTFRDKTSEKEAQKSLHEEKRFTNLAINSIPGIFYVVDAEGKFIRWNDAFVNDLGFREEEVSTLNVFDLIEESDRERVSEIIKDAFETGTGHLITQLRTRRNGLRTYHFFSNRFGSKGSPYLVGTGTDITDMIELEKEKDKNYELMSQLFKNSPLAMVMISPKMDIIKANNSFVSLFGYERDEIVGDNIFKKIIRNGEYSQTERETRQAFEGIDFQKKGVCFTKEGEPRTVLMSTVPVKNGGEVVSVYVVYIDLTEQIHLQNQLEKSLNQKEILLQEVHHRVKNNLAIIAGLLDLQIMEEPDKKVEKELVEARSRIFSIAKIHETLYQEEDVVSIRFDKYLKTITDALPQRDNYAERVFTIRLNTTPLTLNLNQAVPCGLMLNELLNLILLNGSSALNLDIVLTLDGDDIELSITGTSVAEIFDKKLDTFQGNLIGIFLAQIDATLNVEDKHQKTVKISFKKADIRGSSSSFKNMSELVN